MATVECNMPAPHPLCLCSEHGQPPPALTIPALGAGNPFAQDLATSGCGACFEVQCGQGNGTSNQVGLG